MCVCVCVCVCLCVCVAPALIIFKALTSHGVRHHITSVPPFPPISPLPSSSPLLLLLLLLLPLGCICPFASPPSLTPLRGGGRAQVGEEEGNERGESDTKKGRENGQARESRNLRWRLVVGPFLCI